MQLLNNSSPSLLQKMTSADGNDLTRVCSVGFERLKAAGLNYVDSAIVMKSFMDEAKGGSAWYENAGMVKACFGQTPGIQKYLERIYGAPSAKEKDPAS
jgi:hypothetical protein